MRGLNASVLTKNLLFSVLRSVGTPTFLKFDTSKPPDFDG